MIDTDFEDFDSDYAGHVAECPDCFLALEDCACEPFGTCPVCLDPIDYCLGHGTDYSGPTFLETDD